MYCALSCPFVAFLISSCIAEISKASAELNAVSTLERTTAGIMPESFTISIRFSES